MRENTKWIMLVTALAFVGLMVFEWGMDMSGGSAVQFTGGELGSVNGQTITYQEFSEVYQNLYQQAQAGGTLITEAQNRQIEDQAWEQLISERLVDQELRRRGIEVTEEEIRQAARYAPPPEFYQYEAFQTNGQFDLNKYHQFLASGAADATMLRELELYYRRMIPRNKLFQQVGSAVAVTDGELWHLYREATETATIQFVPIDPLQVVSDAEVSVEEREVASYYNSNRENFERPARAEVQVVAVEKTPTAADTAAALERAREIRAEIQAGADFAEVAMRESVDEGSAQRGGALGTVGPEQTVPPFDSAVWAAPIGEVTEPVQTRYGYHLIRVDSREDEQAEVSHILLPIERTLESEDAMYAAVDSLESMVERASLESAAEALGLSVRTTELTPIVPSLPGVGEVAEGLDWVFEERAAVGEISPVFESQTHFYVMELLDREDARTLTLEEARPSVREILVNQKKRDRAREIGRDVVDRIAAGATLEEAAQATGLPVSDAGPFTRQDFVSGIGAGNAAIGAAFGLEVGETSGLVATPDAFYVIRVTDRTEAEREAWEEQAAGQRQSVLGQMQSQRLNAFMEALREDADIVDQRDEVLRAPDQAV
ncbi:MAG TPA: SurA N-terminal domain-containing protein [Longimicrobiales bacterium]|nr:SurA N-terminal domain-containing protein [Longimicrobiales bacterium]